MPLRAPLSYTVTLQRRYYLLRASSSFMASGEPQTDGHRNVLQLFTCDLERPSSSSYPT